MTLPDLSNGNSRFKSGGAIQSVENLWSDTDICDIIIKIFAKLKFWNKI